MKSREAYGYGFRPSLRSTGMTLRGDGLRHIWKLAKEIPHVLRAEEDGHARIVEIVLPEIF